jgi:hypothetical protein
MTKRRKLSSQSVHHSKAVSRGREAHNIPGCLPRSARLRNKKHREGATGSLQ